MIVEASRTRKSGVVEKVNVVIDVFDVICQLSSDWRLSIGVDGNSPIMGGYWMQVTGDVDKPIYNRLRLATREEIIRMDAFKNITEYTVRLF